jgi:hypothetical protein
MVRRRSSGGVRRLKQLVLTGAYRYTDHAWLELADEEISDLDVHVAIVRGHLSARMTHDIRGTRYIMRGPGVDGRLIEVVCRILGEKIRIVTVYRV